MKNIMLVLPLLIFSIFVGCSDDHFTTNPNDRLTFSADTVRFDTVFSTVSSSTKRLMLYNKNSKAINIDLIQLKNGDDSGFRINVDGMRGTSFQTVVIYKKDSMFVFM